MGFQLGMGRNESSGKPRWFRSVPFPKVPFWVRMPLVEPRPFWPQKVIRGLALPIHPGWDRGHVQCCSGLSLWIWSWSPLWPIQCTQCYIDIPVPVFDVFLHLAFILAVDHLSVPIIMLGIPTLEPRPLWPQQVIPFFGSKVAAKVEDEEVEVQEVKPDSDSSRTSESSQSSQSSQSSESEEQERCCTCFAIHRSTDSPHPTPVF